MIVNSIVDNPNIITKILEIRRFFSFLILYPPMPNNDEIKQARGLRIIKKNINKVAIKSFLIINPKIIKIIEDKKVIIG